MELARSLNELNKKRWYRLLRMCFLAAFLTVQTIGILLVLGRTEGEVIAPASFELVGKVLKEHVPAYRGAADEQVGKEVYIEEPVLWAEYVEKYVEQYRVDPVTMYRVYSGTQRVGLCAAAFVLIALFFEMLRRAFYYVIFGTILPRKRRRRRRQVGPSIPS